MVGRSVESVSVSPKIAFAFLLRRARLQRKLTQREAARLLNFSNLYSYQRLESSKIVNPELATLIQLKKAFPELSLDEVLAA